MSKIKILTTHDRLENLKNHLAKYPKSATQTMKQLADLPQTPSRLAQIAVCKDHIK
jgi:hypothetical protein